MAYAFSQFSTIFLIAVDLPRSTWSDCGSLKALDQRVLLLPSTAAEADRSPLSAEEAVAGRPCERGTSAAPAGGAPLSTEAPRTAAKAPASAMRRTCRPPPRRAAVVRGTVSLMMDEVLRTRELGVERRRRPGRAGARPVRNGPSHSLSACLSADMRRRREWTLVPGTAQKATTRRHHSDGVGRAGAKNRRRDRRHRQDQGIRLPWRAGRLPPCCHRRVPLLSSRPASDARAPVTGDR